MKVSCVLLARGEECGFVGMALGPCSSRAETLTSSDLVLAPSLKTTVGRYRYAQDYHFHRPITFLLTP